MPLLFKPLSINYCHYLKPQHLLVKRFGCWVIVTDNGYVVNSVKHIMALPDRGQIQTADTSVHGIKLTFLLLRRRLFAVD